MVRHTDNNDKKPRPRQGAGPRKPDSEGGITGKRYSADKAGDRPDRGKPRAGGKDAKDGKGKTPAAKALAALYSRSNGKATFVETQTADSLRKLSDMRGLLADLTHKGAVYGILSGAVFAIAAGTIREASKTSEASVIERSPGCSRRTR